MTLRKMVMHSLNNLQSVVPGIFCDNTEQIIVREMQEGIALSVTPKADCITQLYFLFQDEAVNKKYQIEVAFKEPHAAIHIRGLYQLHEKQSVEIQTTMHHFVPHCESKQIWKGVLRDVARAKFDGKIIVNSDAQKTIAHLLNHNLLLSKTAEIQTKPTLEIYADDVQCTHGATVGCLDQEALFYLRARGINECEAREILIQAFINEIVETI